MRDGDVNRGGQNPEIRLIEDIPKEEQKGKSELTGN